MPQAFSNLQINYATLANYSPRGTSDLSNKSRKICAQIKAGNLGAIIPTIKHLKSNYKDGKFKDFFGSEVTLVPAPGSSKYKEGNLWVPDLLCKEIVQIGLAKDHKAYLKRDNSVVKSAFAKAGERPSVQDHINSLIVEKDMFIPQKITIIDDVLTKGTTTFACYLKLRDEFPNTPISVFCFIRTQGFQPDIEDFSDPSEGVLTYNGTWVTRTP